MAIDAGEIERLIKARIPDARDYRRPGRRRRPLCRDRHLLLVQGQVAGAAAPMVYEALKTQMGGVLHALALQTAAPDA